MFGQVLLCSQSSCLFLAPPVPQHPYIERHKEEASENFSCTSDGVSLRLFIGAETPSGETSDHKCICNNIISIFVNGSLAASILVVQYKMSAVASLVHVARVEVVDSFGFYLLSPAINYICFVRLYALDELWVPVVERRAEITAEDIGRLFLL